MYTIIGGDGKEYGPVTSDQVRHWLAGGRANLDSKAKAVGTEEWKRLGDFPEFDTVAAPPALSPATAAFAGGAGAAGDLASRGGRLGAAVIDGLISLVCIIPLMMAVPMTALVNAAQNRDWEAITSLPGLLIAGSITGLALLVSGVAQIILLSLRGQTIGKILTGVKVVRFPDRSEAGFVHAWLLRNFVMGIGFMIPLVGKLFYLVDVCFIFRDDRRCLHDLLAGTCVVSVKPRANA